MWPRCAGSQWYLWANRTCSPVSKWWESNSVTSLQLHIQTQNIILIQCLMCDQTPFSPQCSIYDFISFQLQEVSPPAFKTLKPETLNGFTVYHVALVHCLEFTAGRLYLYWIWKVTDWTNSLELVKLNQIFQNSKVIETSSLTFSQSSSRVWSRQQGRKFCLKIKKKEKLEQIVFVPHSISIYLFHHLWCNWS